MLIVYHQNNAVAQISNTKSGTDLKTNGTTIQESLIHLAKQFENEIVVWCRLELKEHLNISNIKAGMNAHLTMMSFETSSNLFINTDIGYVEQSPFIKVKRNVIYPTWLMSSDVGAIHSKVLIAFDKLIHYNLSFDAFLNYVSKRAMPKGVFCYSNPTLLKQGYPIIHKRLNTNTSVIRFIKSNYKFRWVWLYLLNKLIYEKKWLLVPFFKSFFKKSIKINPKINFNEFYQPVHKSNVKIDVIIPTLERDAYLYEVLNDLKHQTILPQSVIIIEQKNTQQAHSTLHFLKEQWPFEIKHLLIHQLGACNARNLALKQVTNDWVFFADDDIRIPHDFFEKTLSYITKFNAAAVTVSCLQENQQEQVTNIIQWPSFGSGCSMVNSIALKNVSFDMAYEHGFGEDGDFGMQLRNKGIDIHYIPFVQLKHLKAPAGGFRAPVNFLWSQEEVQPKPSPTVMVFNLKHKTKQQLLGYKTTLCIKYYNNQTIKFPIKYYNYFKKSWNSSKFWAEKLIKNNAV